MRHPLLDHLEQAARGHFPPPDGGVTCLPALRGGATAVVAFTGHAMVATPMSAADLGDLDLGGFGGAMSPATLLGLAGGGTIGEHDVTLVGCGTGGGQLPRTTAWDGHPRVGYARARRSNVVVHGDERGLVTLASGLAGRQEMSVEVAEDQTGRGVGRKLIGEALGIVDIDTFLFAAVSPGNAQSLRAFLSQGFVPLCSEVLISPATA